MKPQEQLLQIVRDAKMKRASDIHFIEGSSCCSIKLRIDDLLIDYGQLPRDVYQKVLPYIKYRSNMSLNNAYGPQSSAFNLEFNNEVIRIRVSTIITQQSENLVLRLTDSKYYQSLTDLFFLKEQAEHIKQMTNYRNGLVLITGPTGAGKTTLAYALLHAFKGEGRSIVSVEDPVEHYDEDFVQLQINETAGIDYDVSVKEILRHDPDLIFIGEIRDHKSAKSAIRASLTGHLVISTLHSISAIKAIDRLLELGVTLMEMEQVLRLITNQRLGIKESKKAIVLERLSSSTLDMALASIKHQQPFMYETIQELAIKHHIELIKG